MGRGKKSTWEVEERAYQKVRSGESKRELIHTNPKTGDRICIVGKATIEESIYIIGYFSKYEKGGNEAPKLENFFARAAKSDRFGQFFIHRGVSYRLKTFKWFETAHIGG